MSDQSPLRRPLVLATIGITAAAAIIYISLYSKKADESHQSTLHRSNAVRRPRRRWRRGFTPQNVSSDPTANAIRNLDTRIAAGISYGRYENKLLLDLDPETWHSGRYDLLPQNLGPMYRDISSMREMNDLEKETLNHHIESIFLQSFLRSEYPEGYIIGEDVESLVHALGGHGISEDIVRMMVHRFDNGDRPTPIHWDLISQLRTNVPEPTLDGNIQQATAQAAYEALGGNIDNVQNAHDWDDDAQSDPGGSQGMLDLLYHIAGEQAKREGFVHRGVKCNGCQVYPIQGIRYHCANCYDWDLCEICEAQQIHIKTHVFYKIRIPAPPRGQIKEVMPVWYPGQPNQFPSSMSKDLSSWLCSLCHIEKPELESYYEQFRCLAGHSIPLSQDITLLGMAIDRKGFDHYFTTGAGDRPPQSLLYDRIFAFYDTNFDNLITFDEFVKGMTTLQDTTRAAKIKRMFEAYDLDGDGFVDRRDFLRMFRAHYAWHREYDYENIMNQIELNEDLQDAINNSHPISQAFGWTEFASHASRGGQDKQVRANGDLEVVNGLQGVLQDDTDMRGDRAVAVANAAVHGGERIGPNADEAVMPVPLGRRSAPLFIQQGVDSETAETNYRQTAVQQRWQRRQFYLDEEEGMTKPPGYTEPESDSDGESDVPAPAITTLSSRRQSMRSRSSSKVRFDDSAIDTDYETRSNTSSRSGLASERYGGFELSEPEREIGKDIMYQAIQQGFNELLDPLFKEKEDAALEAIQSKSKRTKWAAELDSYAKHLSRKITGIDLESSTSSEEPSTQPTVEITNQEVKEPNNVSQVELKENTVKQPDDEQDVGDQTLPQFLPNDESTSSLLQQNKVVPTVEDDVETEPATPPDEATLAIWHSHRVTEAQSVGRGGYGKLSLTEFKKKMVSESIRPIHGNNKHANHTTTPADSPIAHSAPPPVVQMDGAEVVSSQRNAIGGYHIRFNERVDSTGDQADANEIEAHKSDVTLSDDEDDKEIWNSTADLGKLAFLSSWLEMAKF